VSGLAQLKKTQKIWCLTVIIELEVLERAGVAQICFKLTHWAQGITSLLSGEMIIYFFIHGHAIIMSISAGRFCKPT